MKRGLASSRTLRPERRKEELLRFIGYWLLLAKPLLGLLLLRDGGGGGGGGGGDLLRWNESSLVTSSASRYKVCAYVHYRSYQPGGSGECISHPHPSHHPFRSKPPTTHTVVLPFFTPYYLSIVFSRPAHSATQKSILPHLHRHHHLSPLPPTHPHTNPDPTGSEQSSSTLTPLRRKPPEANGEP